MTGIYTSRDLECMSKPSRRNDKAYERFKHTPRYDIEKPCHYKTENKCVASCLLYEYCTKRGKKDGKTHIR